MSSRRLGVPLRFLRPALVAVLAVDLIALAVFSVRLETTTRTTTTPAAEQVAAPPVTMPGAAPAPIAPAFAAAPVLVPHPSVPSATGSEPPRPSSPVPSTTPTATPTVPDDVSARIARCPIPIKEPTSSGGLQSLIGLAPAFGPFKAEAFAAASAYQPLLQLLGPILAKYPEIAPRIEPAMTPFLRAFAGVLDQGFALIAPIYSPHRDAVLQAESKLAAALAPYAQKLVTSPLGGCVVELQAALLEDTAPTG